MIRSEIPPICVCDAPVGQNPNEMGATVEFINIGLDVGGGGPVFDDAGLRLQFREQWPQGDAFIISINLPPDRHDDRVLEKHIHPVEKDALGVGQPFILTNHILELPKQVILDIRVSDVIVDGFHPLPGFFTRHVSPSAFHRGSVVGLPCTNL